MTKIDAKRKLAAKGLVFHQKLLDRDAFNIFCKTLLQREDCFHCAAHQLQDFNSRLVFPLEELEKFPDFLLRYPPCDINCSFCWNVKTNETGNFINDIKEKLKELSELGISGVKICVNTEVRKLPVCVEMDFGFENTNTFLRGAHVYYELHSHEDFSGRAFVNNLDQRSFPRDFFKRSLVEDLSFLRKLRLRPVHWGVVIDKNSHSDFWASFSDWFQCAQEASIRCIKVSFGIAKYEGYPLGQRRRVGEHWDASLVRKVMRMTGISSDECSTVLNITLFRPGDQNDCDRQYFGWLGEIVGFRTVSGSAARFPLSETRFRGNHGGIWAFFVPDGVCICCFQYGGNPRTVVKELEALLPVGGWVPGEPPGGGSFPLPTAYARDEWDEPMPGTDPKQTVRQLCSEISKWKKKQPIPEKGSLEDQLVQLNEIGFEIGRFRDIDDILDFQSLDWYKERPLIGLLTFISKEERAERICYVDFAEEIPEENLLALFHRIDYKGLMLAGLNEQGVHKNVNVAGEKQSLAFRTFDGKDHRWDFREPMKTITPEFLMRYDELLQQQTVPTKTGFRLYGIKTDENAMILTTRRADEIERINAVLPIPFSLFNP